MKYLLLGLTMLSFVAFTPAPAPCKPVIVTGRVTSVIRHNGRYNVMFWTSRGVGNILHTSRYYVIGQFILVRGCRDTDGYINNPRVEYAR